MALTNAEKQQRHRTRVKERLAQAVNKVCAEEIEAFRKDCEAERAAIADGNSMPEFGIDDLLIDMLTNEAGTDLHGPFLARAMGLPSDPWPDLTLDDLNRMTKGRTKEAKRLGIPTGGGGPYPASFLMKLQAAKHREWLEG
ncbi:hypothetical protein [Methylobacterium sp. Leaf89]|uniref:hypothetical protein n=1 Tax=Methylobacterium sp. Leaf89 TaxID=1736245 RepID=UPI0006FB6F00|nr:hypothetical protein [Methylobacterium sp. Leaf89]KQO73450.1 hypothetical protein ASF18_16795 [Methylobacterium sp. Leaf89]